MSIIEYALNGVFMKLLILALSASISANLFAMDIFCEGWHQLPGRSLEKSRMTVINSSNDGITFETSLHEYKYQVTWNFSLTSLYSTVKKNDIQLLFTTARVPTENHSDSFTDFKLLDGTRLSINCEIE